MDKYQRLDEMCYINTGQSPNSNSYNQEGMGLTFFQGNTDFGVMYPESRVWCSSPKKIVESVTLLISAWAPIGALNFVRERSCIGRGLTGITPRDCVSLRYIYYCQKEENKELNAKGTGSTFKAIAKSALGETSVRIVSEEDQQRIILILDRVSSIVESRNQQFAELDNLIKARIVEMFGDSEFSTMKRPTKKLSELCNVGSSKRQNEQSTEGVPFLRISDLNERIDNVKDVPELFIPINRYNELKEDGLVPVGGDILVTSRGTFGRCCILRSKDEFYFQDGMICWLSKLNNQISSIYLSQLFVMTGVQKQITSLQADSTVAYLSISILKKLDIMLPPFALQNQFATFVEQTDKSKVVVRKTLDESETLFDSIIRVNFG